MRPRRALPAARGRTRNGMRGFAALASMAVFAAASLPASSAQFSPSQSPAPDSAQERSEPLSRAARGASGILELDHAGPPLRARPSSELTAPILVRVASIGPQRYRIEYMGLVSGPYDLRPYLEQTDGRPAQFPAPLMVEVFTQLPPGHGSDIFGMSAPSLGLRAHYRELLAASAALWLLVPAAAITWRIARRKPRVVAAREARAPTVSDRIFAIVDEARTRENGLETLGVDERGRLELLILQELRAAAGTAGTALDAGSTGAHGGPGSSMSSPAQLATATEALRADPVHGPVVRAVERWLHAVSEGEARSALEAIDRLRSSRKPSGDMHGLAAQEAAP